MKSSLLLFAVITLAGTSCGSSSSDRLKEIASEACGDLEDAIVLEAGVILENAIQDAEEEGFTGPDLGDEMRSQCPDTFAALESVGEEQERRENLPAQMEVEVDTCTQEEAAGFVTNNSEITVDVFIDVQFLDEDGIVVDDSIGSISGLRPGEKGKWDAPFLGSDDIDRCRADVSSAFEQ